MIKESIMYSVSRDSNLRYYINSALFILSVVGIPLVFGNFTESIVKNMRSEDNDSDPPEYRPYIETYFDGLLTMIFAGFSLVVPLTIYLSLPVLIDSVNISDPLFGSLIIVLSLFLLLFTLIFLYLFPYMISIQAYRKYNSILENPDNIIKNFKRLFNSGEYNRMFKNFMIISILITIAIQVIVINPFIAPLGLFIVVSYYNMLGYLIGNCSTAIS